MAESEMDAHIDTKAEDAQKAPSTRSPAKKRPTKKAAKKPAKKVRASKTDGDDGEKGTTSGPPKKKVSKKVAGAPGKPGAEGLTVISRRPSKKRALKSAVAKPGETLREEPKIDSIAQSDTPPQAETGNPVSEGRSDMQWGRRAKRSGPIGWEEKPAVTGGARGAAVPAEPLATKPSDLSAKSAEPAAPVLQTPSVPVTVPQESPRTEAAPNPAESATEQPAKGSGEVTAESATSTGQDAVETEARKDQSEQERNRGRSRGGRNNNRGRRGRGRQDDSRNRPEPSERVRPEESRNRQDETQPRAEDSPQGLDRVKQPAAVAASSLRDVLSMSWTEEKTRELLNDGVLARLSPGLVEGHGEVLDDTEALREPLKAIRRVLADECMVADDVADIMLLDVVMGALSDRIEVCRLQTNSQSLQDMDILLDMRCKADKRLIEAVSALKNA